MKLDSKNSLTTLPEVAQDGPEFQELFISSEEIVAWVKSWDTDDELPMPISRVLETDEYEELESILAEQDSSQKEKSIGSVVFDGFLDPHEFLNQNSHT